MRAAVGVVLAGVALGASVTAGSAAARPTYRVAFAGSGTQHHVDVQSYVADDGTCNARESIDQTATFRWSSSWSGLALTAAGAPVGSPAIDGSTVQGTDIKDACGQPLSAAPPDWLESTSCNDALVAAAPVDVAVARRTRTTLVLAVTAPAFAVPVSSVCSLTIRADQLVAHVALPLATLQKLARGKSLAFTVGTVRPGPDDSYAPSLECSRPAKPYDGYKITDACHDDLTWTGTVTLTRV